MTVDRQPRNARRHRKHHIDEKARERHVCAPQEQYPEQQQ